MITEFLNTTITQRSSTIWTENQLGVIWSSIVSIYMIGGVVGSLAASYLADRVGRKGALLIGNIFGLFGGICFLSIPTFKAFELFWIGRLLVGTKFYYFSSALIFFLFK